MSADRHLLFGLLALQCGFISKDQLVAAMTEWSSEKHKPIEVILVAQNALTSHQLELLRQLEEELLAQHDQSAEQSLAALSSIGSVRQALEGLADAQLNATLAHVAKNPEDTSAFDVRNSLRHTRRDGALRYRTIRLHAKGGLGEVFVAKDEELNREVALKEIQERFADHDESRARFKQEAEITGNLEHPGIVPVYGLGQYEDGRPYYAMRFIRGDSLKEAIDAFHSKHKNSLTDGEAGLELRKLLRRFVDVCNAMAYAHSRGVLHRDLKPGNIILGKYGETLVVDWGLAKAQGQSESTDASIGPVTPSSGSGATPTMVGSAVGTPAYMSPEQAAGKVNELNAATDVYSLGATLFHLLTGQLPIAGKTPLEIVQKAEKGEIRRPRELRNDVPKSLEAVCLKAMAKAPGERYASPVALAEDVEKWLADEPVSAYVEPFLVRARRWMRKHPAIVSTSAACVVLGLCAASVVAYLQSSHANELKGKNVELAQQNMTIGRQKSDLEKKNGELTVAKDRAERSEKEATREKAEAESVTQFLVNSFRKTDPDQDGKALTVYDSLVRAQKEIEESKEMDPLNKARLFSAMFESFNGLGMPQEAFNAASKAYDIRKQELGADDLLTLTSWSDLAVGNRMMGKPELAVPILEEVLKLRKQRLGESHPSTLACMNNLGVAYRSVGSMELAIPMFEQSFRLSKESLGGDNPETLKSMIALATAYSFAGKYDKSTPLFETALPLLDSKLGKDHTLTLTCINNLADLLRNSGNVKRAVELFQESYLRTKNKLGDDHPSTLNCKSNLALGLRASGQLEKALPLLEEVLPAMKAKLGEDHPSTLICMSNLAQAYNSANRIDEAIPLYEESVRRFTVNAGVDHPSTLTSMNNLALGYSAAGKRDLALPLFEQVLELRKKKLGVDHPETLSGMNNLAECYRNLGKIELAMPLYEEGVKMSILKLGEDHPNTLVSINNLGLGYRASGKLDLAIEQYQKALNRCREKLPESHPITLASLNNLAVALLESKQSERAIQLFEEFVSIKRKTAKKVDPVFATTLATTADRLMTGEQFAAAEKLLLECYELRKVAQPEHWTTFNTQSVLGGAYLGQKKYAEAESFLVEGFSGMESHKETIPPAAKVRLTEAVARLISLYDAQGKQAESVKWKEKLGELQKSFAEKSQDLRP